MRRLVLGMMLALCALVPDAAAAATEVKAEFELPASNGLEVDVEAWNDEVALAVLDADRAHKSGRYTVYLTKGEALATGVEASFGQFGHISLQFRPTSSRSYPVGPHCPQRWTEQEGLFEGEVEFRGENGYVTIDAHRASGELEVRPCQEPRSRALRARALPAGDGPKRKTGTIFALARDGDQVRRFVASGESDPRHDRYFTDFSASMLEKQERVRIGRVAYAALENTSRFDYDHREGTATVRPPGPFSGQATFARPGSDPRQKGSWRGNLSARFLGHDPVRLTGPGFETLLLKHSPFHDE